MHGIGVIDPATGRPASVTAPDWTSVFSAAPSRPGPGAPTSWPSRPPWLHRPGWPHSGERFPVDRLYDVGIAEQHALTSAAGLALGGMHPVVAIYSTFLNRALTSY